MADATGNVPSAISRVGSRAVAIELCRATERRLHHRRWNASCIDRRSIAGGFRCRAVARKNSHRVDAILVPAAARAGREDEKHAPVALDEVAVSIALLANSRREDRISILRATRVRDAFHADGRHNGCVSAKWEAAEDRQPKTAKSRRRASVAGQRRAVKPR